jgi:hypothetical protein
VHQILWSYNPSIAVTTLVWTNSISLAATIEITIVFSSSGYLDVSVLRVHPPCGVTSLQLAGLPHSEICGSICMCQSPQLIAAYHVLRRLWEPRHSPYALTLLIVLFALLMSYSKFAINHKWLITLLLLFSYFFFQYVNERFQPFGWWWRISESNRWPPACKAGALASWANPPFVSVVSYHLTLLVN